MARVSVDVDDKLFHTLKIHTAYTKSNMKDFVTKAIISQMEHEKQPIVSKYTPSIETIKAFEDTDKGIGLNEYSSWQEMISKLEQEDDEEKNS